MPFLLGQDWKTSSTDEPIYLYSQDHYLIFLAVSLTFLMTENRDVSSANSLGEQESSEGRNKAAVS